ncbi:hypothetical protein GGX14DRAFT_587078, partial [Mycena pura]
PLLQHPHLGSSQILHFPHPCTVVSGHGTHSTNSRMAFCPVGLLLFPWSFALQSAPLLFSSRGCRDVSDKAGRLCDQDAVEMIELLTRWLSKAVKELRKLRLLMNENMFGDRRQMARPEEIFRRRDQDLRNLDAQSGNESSVRRPAAVVARACSDVPASTLGRQAPAFGLSQPGQAEPCWGPETAFGPAWYSKPRPSRKAPAFTEKMRGDDTQTSGAFGIATPWALRRDTTWVTWLVSSEAEFKKPAYEWQIDVSEAIVLELEAVVIAGTGAE